MNKGPEGNLELSTSFNHFQRPKQNCCFTAVSKECSSAKHLVALYSHRKFLRGGSTGSRQEVEQRTKSLHTLLKTSENWNQVAPQNLHDRRVSLQMACERLQHRFDDTGTDLQKVCESTCAAMKIVKLQSPVETTQIKQEAADQTDT